MGINTQKESKIGQNNPQNRPSLNFEGSLIIDHLHCYQNGQAFFPLIQDRTDLVFDWSNSVTICLPAHPSEDLDWSEPILQAKKFVAAGKWILWELDFGLGKGTIDLNDSTAFYSYVIAIEEFISKIYQAFCEQTFGLIVYRGKDDWATRMNGSAGEESLTDARIGSFPIFESQAVCAADLFAQYLHRLVSFLPDGVAPFALIDADSSLPLAHQALVFSRRRFEHLHLAVRGTPLLIPGLGWDRSGSTSGWIGREKPTFLPLNAPRRAICLPLDKDCDMDVFQKLESLLFSQKGLRLICEERLTQEWNDVDQLILFSDRVSPLGKRMLQGFSVAGGEITDIDKFLLEN